MNRPAKRSVIRTVCAALVLLAVLAVWALASRGSAGGDPGSAVMDQLTPAVSSLPGYGTDALPWVNQIPESMLTPYAIKIEPFQDSCDGMAGTRGWSQVVVQAGFKWTRGLKALVAKIDPRLTELGWTIVSPLRKSYPPNQDWTKTLDNGSRAVLSVTKSAGAFWQLDAVAKPIGKAASGC